MFFLAMLFAATALPQSAQAQASLDKICSSPWFVAERKELSGKHHSFQLLNEGAFNQDGSSYLLAVNYPTVDSPEFVEFMVFAAPEQSLDFQPVWTEKIDIFDAGNELAPQQSECVTKGASFYFKASVVDLAGDGHQQIIVESNRIGVCSSCLSEVRVYQVEKKKIFKVVEGFYNDIKFGKGQGLWLQSFRNTDDGSIVLVEKTFFGAKKSQGTAP
jgi:hypothetical protein